VGRLRQGGHGPPWIFIHGTDVVDIGLKVLFFGLFFAIFRFYFRCPPPLGRGLIVLSRSFLLFFGIFSLPTPENFSAEALVGIIFLITSLAILNNIKIFTEA